MVPDCTVESFISLYTFCFLCLPGMLWGHDQNPWEGRQTENIPFPEREMAPELLTLSWGR